jgi:hypothetical protein
MGGDGFEVIDNGLVLAELASVTSIACEWGLAGTQRNRGKLPAEGGVKNAKMCFKAGMSTPETPKARGSSQNLIPELLGDTAPIWIAFGVHLRASLL